MLRVQRAATGFVRPCINAIQIPRGVFQQRKFHDSCISLAKSLPPRTKVEEKDLEEAFVTGSGPGGQKINKTSSAVRLTHKPTGLSVKVQDSRSQEQNRKIARQRLGEIIQYHEKGDESRMALKIQAKVKKKASARKKTLRKYRMLDELKQAAEESSEGAKSSAAESGSDGTKSSTAKSEADGAKPRAAASVSGDAKSGGAVS